MPPKKAAPPAPVYQLKVTLKGTTPPVWRRVLVPADIKFSRLHDVIQEAMGWQDAHLHEFRVGGQAIGVPDPEHDAPGEVRNESRVTLGAVVPGEGSRFDYAYDFGDDWQHTVLVEKVLPPGPGRALPLCLGGKRACPPEDCGGVWGYADLLASLADPDHPERAQNLTWLGGAWDAEAFHLDAANERLARIRKR